MDPMGPMPECSGASNLDQPDIQRLLRVAISYDRCITLLAAFAAGVLRMNRCQEQTPAVIVPCKDRRLLKRFRQWPPWLSICNIPNSRC